MRALVLIGLVLAGGSVLAELQPETVGKEELGKAADTWFLVKGTSGPGYLFDAADGEMLGTLSLSSWTPTVERHASRNEIYAAETYYTRRFRGDRNDVLTVYDHATLSPIAEIDLPDKTASLNFPEYMGLLGNRRHLTVFNMTPAQSVSVVDVRRREFVGEIATPGCALTMAAGERGFLQLCGDGTLQLVQLDRSGEEANRTRSDSFFSVEEDPVYDQPVRTDRGWQLLTFEGRTLEVTVEEPGIVLGDFWTIVDEKDKGERWRPGGGQIMDVHRDLDLLFVLMHQGGTDTHEDPGTEVWILDRGSRTRIGRLTLERPGRSIIVTQNGDPRLIVSAAEAQAVDVYQALKMKKERSVVVNQFVGSLVLY